jgi:drug/metabolite transporter (DMT)-like permease
VHRIRTHGAALAALAYSSLSFGDALVKSQSGKLDIFHIGFFTTGTAMLFILLLKPRAETWAEAFRMQRPLAIAGRAAAGLCASLLGIIAFTRLPLSDAYALIFLAPFLSAALGAMLLKEPIGAGEWSAIAIGLAGVLLVVRPGFEAFEPAHFAALGVAVAMAIGIVIMRTIAAHEKRTAILFVLMASAFVCYGTIILIRGGFHWPEPPQLLRLVSAGAFGALGQALLLRAASQAPANRIAPAQYWQLLIAVILGALFFGEYPDLLKLAGLLLIAVGGLISIRAGRQPAG